MHKNDSGEQHFDMQFMRPSYGKRIALFAVLGVVLLIMVLMTWSAFFHYVPPGKHLVVISNDGELLSPGEVLAGEGQKGIRKQVLAEGWHFVMPIVFETRLEDNTVIATGKVGIVTALGGTPVAAGEVLANDGERGIQRAVLRPGAYRINRHGYDVDMVDAVEIKPGFVGVQRRLLGKDSQSRYAEADGEKGILHRVLQPGLYYLNPKEYEVIKIEVGISQTTFHYDQASQKNTAIKFTAKGGYEISLDCTIEWEVLPEEMPSLVAEYGDRKKVEERIIIPQAKSFSRLKGLDFGVKDFLEGDKRERFQEDFTQEMIKVCKEKNVKVHSAFIRNIVIPEDYLKEVRDRQISTETALTNKAKEATALSAADVEREKQMVDQKVAEVQAETARMVAGIDREVANIETKNQAEIEKLKAEYDAKIAKIEAERTTLLGEAEADVKKLKDTAKSSIYELKMKVFNDDGNAFLRYSMADQLNPKMMLRVFHSGPGTFWTNMDGKGMNLLLPTPGGAGTKATSAPK